MDTNNEKIIPVKDIPVPTKEETAAAEEKPAEDAPEETEEEKIQKAKEELRKTVKEGMEKQKALMKEANEAIASGKGRLKLESPIEVHDQVYTELVYDFTVLKGIEYTDAMGVDPNSDNAYRITQRQALALFAKAAAKQTDGLDMQDIQSEIGVTDALEGVQLATIFFNASTRAGRMRISKK